MLPCFELDDPDGFKKKEHLLSRSDDFRRSSQSRGGAVSGYLGAAVHERRLDFQNLVLRLWPCFAFAQCKGAAMHTYPEISTDSASPTLRGPPEAVRPS